MRPPRANAYRDAWAGELRAGDVDSTVRVAGWVHRRRDHGGLIFIDLRDRTGIVQLVFHPETAPEAHALAERLRSEHVVSATGTIVRREEGNVNPKLETGEIELEVAEAETLAEADTPPFPVDEETPVDELLRLRHRVIDLRRAGMQRAMTDPPHGQPRDPRLPQRARLPRDGDADHDALHARGRARLPRPLAPEPGRFYALPQSPQLFKQMLMMAGFERYYQIARCFRDEDLRADRQPEFTQLDLEMSFVDEEDVIETDRGDARARLRGDRLPGRAAAVAAHDATTRRCCATAPTGPTCASGSRSPTSARRWPRPSSASSPACSPAAAWCAGSTPARTSCRARTSTG